MKERHPPSIPVGRTCWICGKPCGCYGFTNALRLLGYNVGGQVAHAHRECIAKELRKKPDGDKGE